MKLKKQEFLALKQGSMSVSEYQDKFIQLSTMGRISTSTPTNTVSSSSKLNVLVSQCSVPTFTKSPGHPY
jgi:hypothetical protein